MKKRILWLLIGLSFYFPAFVIGTSVVLLGLAVALAQPLLLLASVANLYLLPLLTYRVFHLFYPVFEGKAQMWPLDDDNPSSWIVSHKLQLVFEAMPFLEHVLVLVPGLYAFWLRLWGSKVGGDTFFTPQVEVTDRGLVDIGDHAFFGHRVFMSSHIVTKKGDAYVLYVRRIRIGEGCFVGAMSSFGPGTDIAPGTFVPLSSYTLMDDTEPRSMIRP